MLYGRTWGVISHIGVGVGIGLVFRIAVWCVLGLYSTKSSGNTPLMEANRGMLSCKRQSKYGDVLYGCGHRGILHIRDSLYRSTLILALTWVVNCGD